MDAFALLLDDAAMLIRWLHVLAAFIWVGSAIALLKLELAMRPRNGEPQVLFLHAGAGFRLLRAQNADGGEAALSFRLESYVTWLSGFALLVMLFCLAPRLTLIDPALWNAAPWAAVTAALLPLALSWLAYDALCKRSGLGGDALLFTLFLFAAALALALTHVFYGRAAYLLIGAHLGTIMVANIAHAIAPAQRRRLAALRAGLPADEADAAHARARALHNQYLASPTIFFMLSGHAPLLFAGPYNGVSAVAILVGFFMIRRLWLVFLRGAGLDGRLVIAAIGCFALAFALSWPSAPAPRAEAHDARDAIGFALRPGAGDVQRIIESRCAACHSAAASMAGLGQAAGGLDFTKPDVVARRRADILRAAVFSRAMPPPGGAPGLDDEEKSVLIRWSD